MRFNSHQKLTLLIYIDSSYTLTTNNGYRLDTDNIYLLSL